MLQGQGRGGDASDTTTTAYIKPESPWENGFAESLNGRLSDEFLNAELFSNSPQTQLLADRWRWGPTHSGQTQPPWRQLNRELQHDHIHPSDKDWEALDMQRRGGHGSGRAMKC